jgi:predicted O-methyltransferase YrrM
MDSCATSFAAGLAAALIILRADLRRRRLSLRRASGWSVLTVLDVLCPVILSGTIAAVAVLLVPVALSAHALPLGSPLVWRIAGGAAITAYIWTEGRKQIQFQRPGGIVCGEAMILTGVYSLVESFALAAANSPVVPHGTAVRALWIVTVLAGAALIALVVHPFLKGSEEHRILDRIADQGESVQAEYVPGSPECPHPERWHMVDTKSTELEVIEFLKSVVTTVKPQLIVETGTFLGYGSLRIAAGLQENGFGKLITIEHDPAVFAKAKERIDASGLGKWIEYRNESSLETRIEGMIDVLFSDSYGPIREQEVRRFLPQIDPRGLILVHDAGSHFGVVREAMLRLEREGLISTVLLSTPRGLAIAQKREGRK